MSGCAYAAVQTWLSTSSLGNPFTHILAMQGACHDSCPEGSSCCRRHCLSQETLHWQRKQQFQSSTCAPRGVQGLYHGAGNGLGRKWAGARHLRGARHLIHIRKAGKYSRLLSRCQLLGGRLSARCSQCMGASSKVFPVALPYCGTDCRWCMSVRLPPKPAIQAASVHVAAAWVPGSRSGSSSAAAAL